MAQFDLFVVNVALPVLQRDLKAGDAALQLIVGGYAFVYAAGLITAGRLGDRIGHRTVFLLGMGAFGLASLWCGLAQSRSSWSPPGWSRGWPARRWSRRCSRSSA
jgi:MFS family permease